MSERAGVGGGRKAELCIVHESEIHGARDGLCDILFLAARNAKSRAAI